MSDQARAWHAESTAAVLDRLGVDAERGLATREAERRYRKQGPNRLQEVEGRRWWRILGEQFQSIVVYLLGVAALLAFLSQRWAEGIAVVAVILVNTAIGFFSELQAVRSMSALRAMGEHRTRVRRDGEEREIAAPVIVPGDLVLVRAGDLVPADLRLLAADQLRADEAPLTGESVPADKTTDPVPAETDLAERRNMLYKGTSIADGTAIGIAVATGPETELGRISKLAEKAESETTPLQRRLNQLGRRLAWLTVGIAGVVAVLGFLVRHQETALVIETALALGIAAIPEGLPVVATIALARGMYKMAKRNALVNRLTAVETLGATRIIFSDKTGTLTENRMRLVKVATPAGVRPLDGDRTDDIGTLARLVLEVGALCNRASLEEPTEASEAGPQRQGGPVGDPTEIALLAGAREMGISRDSLLADRPQVRVEAFEPRIKKMATYHRQDGGVYVAVKGAPEAVLDCCEGIVTDEGGDAARALDEDDRAHWRERATELAGEGLRLLAMADKRVASPDEKPYEGLRFLGLVGLLDPPRQGVKDAVDRCQAAGIRVEMVTGDQPETAKAIARAVGIIGDADDPDAVVMLGRELEDPQSIDASKRERIYRANIFARVSPEQKLNLVRVYQDRGKIVAMTGDGINDAPALKKADIGVAMGKRGTEAAKQAADMVLQDDAFETIVTAVEQGRVIFGNIRKAVIFMLTTNVAEVLAVAVAALAGWSLPLRPLQILYLNVLTDVFPALALGMGPASGHEMQQAPRGAEEAVLTRRHWAEIGGFAVVVGASVLGALLLAEHWLGLGPLEAVTVSFLTLGFGKLWFTFNLRGPRSGLLHNEVTRNPWVWGAIVLCILLLIAALYLPGLSDLLQTKPLGWEGWVLLSAMSLTPLLIGQVVREVQRRRR